MKFLKTLLLLTTLISSILLWETKPQPLPSLSAFALEDNALYYRIMLLSASWFFLINALEFKKYVTEYILALGMGLILVFDMYHFPITHNIIVGVTFLLACITLIINTHKQLNEALAMVIVILAILTFIVGYFEESIHLLFAEVVAMTLISTGKLIEIHS